MFLFQKCKIINVSLASSSSGLSRFYQKVFSFILLVIIVTTTTSSSSSSSSSRVLP